MLEHLNRYFIAVTNLRRSERALVQGGAALALSELRKETGHPLLQSRINTALNEHTARKTKAA